MEGLRLLIQKATRYLGTALQGKMYDFSVGKRKKRKCIFCLVTIPADEPNCPSPDYPVIDLLNRQLPLDAGHQPAIEVHFVKKLEGYQAHRIVNSVFPQYGYKVQSNNVMKVENILCSLSRVN